MSRGKTDIGVSEQLFLYSISKLRLFPIFSMDIKTLLDNLNDQVSCSVCMCTFTDPKQLPCLHSFCLQCLNDIQRSSGVHGQITCPECRRQFQIPGSGTPSELPTNFRINSLLDVLTIKECSTANVKCGNCDKRSAQTLYCFQCCSFWCEECILGHNIIRTNKEHRTLALKDFQDQDIEAVLQRPAFCQQKLHEKEELTFFCKDCKVAICNTCAVTLHDGHGKMLLQEAIDARKTQISSVIKSLKDKALEKRKEVEQLKKKSTEVQDQVADVKSQVQMNVDQITAIIRVKKQNLFDAVDYHAKKSLESLQQKKNELENQARIIESAIEKTESLLKRSSSTEILGFSETFDTILQEERAIENRNSVESIPARFSFNKSENLIEVLNSEGIGNVKVVSSETKAKRSEAACEQSCDVFDEKTRPQVRRASQGSKRADLRRGSQCSVDSLVAQPMYFIKQSFGQKGKSFGMLYNPYGVAVNGHDEIAVTENSNHRVSVFSSDGTHLRSFGKKGKSYGEFQYPTGIAFDSLGNIVVADNENHRVQIFDSNGNFLRAFGKPKSRADYQLKCPEGLSINDNDDIIVADTGNQLIKIFSSSGEYLRKFGGPSFFASPCHCIQHGHYLIVSDCSNQTIKLFNHQGKFISKFGREGHKSGELNKPRYLSVNKEGLLMVCDSGNHRVQVFELSGKFVTKFGSKGNEKGEFKHPNSTANLSDGRVAVCDGDNHRIQIFD